MRKKNKDLNNKFKKFDKFDVILGFLILLLSLFFVFVLTPVKIWQQYAEKEAVQVVITPLGEKNKASYYNQITIDHLEIDGQSYDLADYVQSGTWDESRNTLTWEDKGGYSDSIVLNIPGGGERKLVFSSSVYRGLVKVSYDNHQDIVDCYTQTDGFYEYDLSGKIRYGNGVLYVLKLLCLLILSALIFYPVKLAFLHIENRFKKFTKWDLIAILAIVIFSMLCVCTHTDSPWSKVIPWTDSDDFIYIGWAVSKGQIPYVDFFDHKGFYFFFLEFLGYRLTNSYVGIWILEWIAVLATLLLSYKTLRRYTSSAIALLGIAAGYIYAIFYLSNGNYVEVFTMPWIALGIYMFGKYFEDNRYRLTNLEIFGLGVSFLFVMMMRQNNTGIWFLGCYFIVVHQFVQKKYMEILRYGIIFVGSILIAFLPGLFYLIAHGAWKDFIETYWLFNFGYVAEGGDKLNAIMHFGLTLPSIIVIVGAILAIINRKKWEGYGLALIGYYGLYGISLLFAGMAGYTWEHYAIGMLPLFPIGCLIFFKNIKIMYESIQSDTLKTLMYFILGLLIVGALLDSKGNLIRGTKGGWITKYNSSNRYIVKVISRRIREKTDSEQKISVIGNFGAYYWVSQRLSASKYFYQMPPIAVSQKIETEYLTDLNNNMPEAIVVAGTDLLGEHPEFEQKIRDLLKNNYVLDFEQDKQQLYFRKDVLQ